MCAKTIVQSLSAFWSKGLLETHSVLKGGELRNFVFRENQLTGALAGVELSRDQPAAEVDQVILTHFWPKNGQKWPKITFVTVRLTGGPKLVDQT